MVTRMGLYGFMGAPIRDAQRVLVAGTSGSGKSTLCRRLRERLELPYVELDSLYHGPHWSELPTFESDVERLITADRWVLEWQYDRVRERLLERCDLLIWLDYPAHVVMWRVVVRTIRRELSQEMLWNGNTEPPLWTVMTNPEHIIRWAWRTHRGYPRRIRRILEERPRLRLVWLRSPRECDALLDRLR
ncbi:MAG: AAA family ATPase [Ferrimicrobium sp.]